MATVYGEVTREVNEGLSALRKAVPDVMKGFGELSAAAMKPGALDAKHKELIALAIGIASRCDACIGFHVRSLVRLGCTREELMETLAVNIYMGGGPDLMYAAHAVRAWDEFSAG